ncbi:Regulatory protein uhpC [Serratia marcescens]|uniref:MFS transporter n=1 Tax=Serratia marcescens TaxID=615 RepID=UPI000744FE22|nr:MFS transporter [Serratia marcescens]CUZ69975.1 Regulatory protein uhpC [Serratia marcescens]CVA28506.1 Regulatory protein uhpC [Serratia marcescens]CVB43735.1 Regulatory protein uhpC [Serratia marcescens]CVC27600.1 Regulatory protein uhpC [Serratia marcescens]CVD30093.1 Regulatory protein uhpC [Serratia marcescens]
MWSFLKSRPDAPQVTDQRQIDASYKYWRIQLMCTMYIGYAAFYFTRKSFNFIMPAMLSDLGLTMSDVGILGTLFYITYGCSKFISGMISDRSNPRYFMGLGLIMTGVLNIFFGLSSSLLMLGTLWILNAFFQGWGWPPCSKILTSWYSRSERGGWWAIWNTSHNVGGALIPLLVGFISLHFSWRYGMIIPGIIGVVLGLLMCWRLRDKPSTLGLPSVGKWRNDAMELVQESEGQGLSNREIIKRYVLTNKYIWLLAVSYVLVYIVRTAINDWGNLYLTQEKGYSLMTANSAISLFEVGGFIGSLVAGWGSDKLFRGNRGPMNLIFAIGIFIFGPQMLIGMAAAECSHKDAAGAATGFVGLFAYLGAALSGYPIARVMEIWHWNGFFVVISIAACLSALFLLPFLRAQTPALKPAKA